MAEAQYDLLNDSPDELLEAFERTSYEARDIAQSEEIHTVRLTRIDGLGGRPVFGDDLPAEMHIQRRELRCGKTLHAWFRVEYKLFAKPYGRHQHLVAAQWPYYNGWVARTKFKPSRRVRTDDTLPPDNLKSTADVLQWVESLPFDYWETRTGTLTAGVSRPERMDWSDRPRNVHQNAYTLLGICEDFDACFEQIKASAEIQELLRLSRAGVIRFGHADLSKSGSGKPPKLNEDLRVQCEYLMDLSIHQALAGPKGDTAPWRGCPVFELVDSIYRDTLNRHNRSARRATVREGKTYADPEQAQLNRTGRALWDGTHRTDEGPLLWFDEFADPDELDAEDGSDS